MPLVTFLPSRAAIEVAAGTALLDAAAAAGVAITAPCGGEGACGECRVRVVEGELERLARGCLAPEELGAGWALACSSRVTGDVAIEVIEESAAGARIVGAQAPGATAPGAGPPGASAPGAASVGGPAVNANGNALFDKTLEKNSPPSPPAVRLAVPVEPPSLENSFSDLDRLERALRAADPTLTAGLTAPLDVLQTLGATLRAGDHQVTATLARPEPGAPAGAGGPARAGAALIELRSGDSTRGALGLAIDIGTTTCAASLVDLARGRVLGTATDYNSQRTRGLDVISRINYARLPERRAELRRLVLETLNGLIARLAEGHGAAARDLDCAVVAGNTTMIHQLLGIDAEQIRLEPYTPAVNRVPPLAAAEVGLAIAPRAPVVFAPGVGSYVGGDITAGLLMTPMARGCEAVQLFLDIGTNGEIVVGNGEWLMGCAASAGPAFEGAGIRCGMRAVAGAIERVRFDGAADRPELAVVGGGPARGVCGSGMIDLLAGLRRVGALDPSGKLVPECGGGRVRASAESARVLEYELVAAEANEAAGASSAAGAAISLNELEIQNLLRAKAAIYSACALMLKAVGLDFDAVERVWVAGGFGRYLDLRHSIEIGLLPDLPLERFVYLGNSSLAGATAMLLGAEPRAKAAELADRLTYLELNTDPDYMNEYTGALFLPHTDIQRFPTVSQ